jgi:glutamate-1-semialdehyde 2,1-aminomutase
MSAIARSAASAALYRRARESLPGGNTRTTVFMSPHPVYAARGEGCRIIDADGVSRIDAIANFTALIHGHAHPVINEAVARQLALGTAFGMPTESEIDLAELLKGRVASIDMIRFTNSGTEAVMMALKAARAFTGRPKIAKCEGAYHGSYDYAEVSLETQPDQWLANDPPSTAYAAGTPQGVLSDVVAIPFNDTAASGEILHRHGREIAAILVDPMPNRAGLVAPDPDYLRMLRNVADEIGALLIFDEVITFRLGYHGAQGLFGIRPDLTVLGKIMGGGFPVGAVGGRADVMAVFDPSRGKPKLPHGGTFSANPVTMRAGQAAMQLLDQATFTRLDVMGERIRQGLRDAFARHGIPGQATGAGSLIKVHFTDRPIQDYRSAFPRPDEKERLNGFVTGLMNHGVIVAGYGLLALSTPMVDADIAFMLEAFDTVIGAIAEGA